MPRKSTRTSAHPQIEPHPYVFKRETVKEQLLRDLSRKAVGTDGSADAFVMLLQLIRDAIPEPTNEHLEATRLIFHAQSYAFNNSPYYVRSFMDYRERLRMQLARHLRE